MPPADDPALAAAMERALDALLAALDLQPLGGTRFRARPAADLNGRVYGGQLLAQALVAAGRTVAGKAPRALQAAFVKAGTPGRALEVLVDRVRDGRSLATRQVSVVEDGVPLLVAVASFHDGPAGDEPGPPPPPVPRPEETPLLQHWAGSLPVSEQRSGRHWVEQPPPLEIRIGEALSFLGGTSTSESRSHWMRLRRDVGEDPLLHAALLAYASDFFLMDMVFRAHPARWGPGRLNGYSLDHALWFHRPVRFGGWHLHTQQALAVVGDRGLARGALHDESGRLVATAVQEVLVIPGGQP